MDVYNDEFDIKTDPSNGNVTKFHVIYITIANLGYDLQSKRNDIILHSICTKESMAKIPLDGFIQPLVKSIIDLNKNKISLGKKQNLTLHKE